MKPSLEVLVPGLQTTVQDLGRLGHQAQGVPTSGALDFVNLRLANALVGNEAGQGALEIRLTGPTMRVNADSLRIALCGTSHNLELLEPVNRKVPSGQSVTLQRGQTFRIGQVKDSAVCYLAISGGFDLPALYGSQSTYLLGGFGGFEGRVLQAGDHLPLNENEAPDSPDLALGEPLATRNEHPIRVVLGPQDDYFSQAGLETFLGQTYKVSAKINRMGMQLDGLTMGHPKGYNINSDGIVTGSIQVPGHGLPIILLADHQSTGGYPKIATVASADIPRLGRMAPGADLRFKAVSVEEAEQARRQLERDILEAIASIRSLP